SPGGRAGGIVPCHRLRPRWTLPNYLHNAENGRERVMEPVKFVALDRDDLEVVSTHLQDALVKVADVMWRPQEKRLVIALSRFDWLSAEGTKPELRRCRAALRARKMRQRPKRQSGRQGRRAQPARGRIFRDRSAGRDREPHLLGRGDAAARGRMPGSRARRSGAILARGRASDPC